MVDELLDDHQAAGHLPENLAGHNS